MADVQLEKGYIRIANALYDAVQTAPFTDSQRRVVSALIRLSYGWGRKTVEIAVPDLAKLLDLKNSGGFRGGVSEIIDAGVLQLVRGGTGRKPSVFAVQKDHEQWGVFSVSAAVLGAKWAARPSHADSLLALSIEGDDAEDEGDDSGGDGDAGNDPPAADAADSTEGASGKAPSLAVQGACTEASMIKDACTEAATCLPTGTLGPSKSFIGETYTAGKTGKTVEPITTTTTRADAGEISGAVERIDPAGLLRWDELSLKLSTDHNRAHIVAFFGRLKPGERHAWSARLANWLSGLDCPPSYTPTAEVLATAMSEYTGDHAPRHVWSFVEDAVRRWERAKGDGKHMRFPAGAGRVGAPDPAVRQRAQEIWAVVKREGLATCNPNLIAQRVRDLERLNKLPSGIADADAFLALFSRFPRSTLSAARNDHFAEQAILEVLSVSSAA